MASHPHPRVAGFAFTGDPGQPVVCVLVQQGEETGIWIGRAWPGAETYVITEPVDLRPATIEAARVMLEGWPETRGHVANALQEAAIRGRQALIDAKMQAGLNVAWDSH